MEQDQNENYPPILEYETVKVAADQPLLHRMLMLVFVWTPVGLVFSVIVGVLMGMACSLLGFVGAPIAGLIGAYTIFHMQQVRRRRRAMIVLSYLETATRLNLPLNDYLLAAELSERGTTRTRLHDLRIRLQSGMPLAAAMYDTIPEMPASVIDTTQVGESLGQLQPTLKRLVKETATPTHTDNDRLPFYRFYGLSLCVVTFNLTALFMIFIIPKFKEIFRDFGTTLPPATVSLIVVSDAIADSGWILLVLVGLAFLAIVGWLLERSFMLRRESGQRRILLDKIFWNLPVLGRLTRAKSMAELCNVLAQGTNAGIPLPQALERAHGLNINSEAKHQIRLWQQALAIGQSPADAAQTAGMPDLIVGLMTPAQSSPGTTNAFDFLARYYRGQFSRLMITLQAAAEPAIVLVMGLFVAWLTIAMFSPLAKLIDSMTQPPWWNVL